VAERRGFPIRPASRCCRWPVSVFRVATYSAEDMGKVSSFRSLCCMGSIPARAVSLDDRLARRTPSWSGDSPTPERSTGRAEQGCMEKCFGRKDDAHTNGWSVRHDPFEHLGARVLLAWTTALRTARRSKLDCALAIGTAATIDTRRAETRSGSAAPGAQESVTRPAGGGRPNPLRALKALLVDQAAKEVRIQTTMHPASSLYSQAQLFPY
jgi:hypothetical protein